MAFLFDVNLLVALAWPSHVHHQAALAWFQRNQAVGWATCRSGGPGARELAEELGIEALKELAHFNARCEEPWTAEHRPAVESFRDPDRGASSHGHRSGRWGRRRGLRQLSAARGKLPGLRESYRGPRKVSVAQGKLPRAAATYRGPGKVTPARGKLPRVRVTYRGSG